MSRHRRNRPKFLKREHGGQRLEIIPERGSKMHSIASGQKQNYFCSRSISKPRPKEAAPGSLRPMFRNRPFRQHPASCCLQEGGNLKMLDLSGEPDRVPAAAQVSPDGRAAGLGSKQVQAAERPPSSLPWLPRAAAFFSVFCFF